MLGCFLCGDRDRWEMERCMPDRKTSVCSMHHLMHWTASSMGWMMVSGSRMMIECMHCSTAAVWEWKPAAESLRVERSLLGTTCFDLRGTPGGQSVFSVYVSVSLQDHHKTSLSKSFIRPLSLHVAQYFLAFSAEYHLHSAGMVSLCLFCTTTAAAAVVDPMHQVFCCSLPPSTLACRLKISQTESDLFYAYGKPICRCEAPRLCQRPRPKEA